MKTARFTEVVKKSGKPVSHLVLMAPGKDRPLQAAIKAGRVMTIVQSTVGTKTDRGEIGFEPGPNRQFLVFPKSLKPFAGREVIGIKYDLLSSPEVPKSQRAAPPRAPRKAKTPREERLHREDEERPTKPAPKLVPFRPAEEEEEEEENADVTELKKAMRKAMDLLEDGKAVAAFNLLKRTIGD